MRIAIPNKQKFFIIFPLIVITIIILTAYFIRYTNTTNVSKNYAGIFNGTRALEDVIFQVDLGARIPGSEAHAKTVEWIQKELKSNHWKTEIASSNVNGKIIHNIVGKKGDGKPWIIIGAHFDSRIFANNDPDPNNQKLPVPGANDGASGVAVLLELSRMLGKDISEISWAKQIWLVFFDAEDNGEISGWSWIMGSREFANNLQDKPDVVVVLDMIGDENLNIFRENKSNDRYTEEIWNVAADLGFENFFIPENKHTIIDDHVPFLEKGIPAVDIIDFDYPYWHTIADTPDKVSAQSLYIVGTIVYTWLTQDSAP